MSGFSEIEKILCSGGVGVFPTDTLYGLVGSALSKKTVEKIYKIRKRELDKPMIILISSFSDLGRFGINLSKEQKVFLKKNWPGKLSIIFDCGLKKFEYLHRGKKTLAFRFPKDDLLRSVIKKTGPLVAPSANISGKDPAETISEAKEYFGDKIDFYIDAGKIKSKPSTLIKLEENGNFVLLREGAVKIKQK